MKRIGIVMAGGSGERFWPLSTPERPKQLLDLTGSGKSLLGEAIERLTPAVDEVYVSTTTLLAGPIAESGLIAKDRILAEPHKRNTAGAILWSMASLRAVADEPFFAAITTSDHAISPSVEFQADVSRALELADDDLALVVIGVPPCRPETGFGYIEMGDGYLVRRFAEKPDQGTAAKFVASGNHLWNSGMFFWRSDAFIHELYSCAPDHAQVLQAVEFTLRSGEHAAAATTFAELPSISIDYALMERSSNVRCVRASFAWDDVGSWDALLRSVPLDNAGNAIIGNATVIDCTGCVVYNDTPRPLAVLGQRDQIVVATETATMSIPIARAQDVRKLATS